ncbi:MAG TPA: polymer-forming cytoskeletal protein, partial [Pyrinomonadaceae bacterium]
ELGRAAKVNGNIQTPSLVIEQGAVFEGSCRMVQQKAAMEKSRDDSSSKSSQDDSSALDTSSMQPISDSASSSSSDISDVSDVAS